MLQIQGVTKSFGHRVALHEVHVEISKGVVGLLGPNGAGKTTLLRVLATVYSPTTGRIELHGVDWDRQVEEARRRIGYLPQHVGLFPALTSYEYLDYFALMRGITDSKKRRDIVHEVLQEVNLIEKSNSKIRKLSGGMKQRLGIAQAIIHNPQLLLLDEPTAGLDPEERLRFRGLIRRLADNRIVIISTHITDDISMTCDQVCVMKKGRLEYFPSPSEISHLANGKVWSVDASFAEYSEIERMPDYQIVNSMELDGRIRLRILSSDQPSPAAVSADPTLEEGYLIWLKGR
ncbi:ABC transporter ATP-binding protein [Paenibacillus sp. YYML68]|uniref:ABC transporter ATP-binding protein n=1 Tax=Paenibacillus sp. YYML68 TaxID=2909250 RepID=UPI0024930491|nr:ABC transporter ATP-binding protein [Paenibacillus sp. YYML68]